MPKAHSPRKRGHDGRAASARFVELEHTLAASGQAASGQQLETFTYDETGNWLQYTSHEPLLDQHRAHDKANQIDGITNPAGVVQPAYDSVGNMVAMPSPADWTQTGELVWDAWNRLVKLTAGGNEISYQYDALTRRTAKALGEDDPVQYYYDRQWRAVEERVSGAVAASYVWSPVDRWTQIKRKDADGELYILKDYLDPAAVIGLGADVIERFGYDAFGPVRFMDASFAPRAASAVSWNFLFHAEFQDTDSGLYNYGYRYYHPELGRWLSRDPIGERGGVNLYGFASNYPTTIIDRLGLDIVAGVPGCGIAIPAGERIELQKIFDDWYNRNKDKSWNDNLPACPCKLPSSNVSQCCSAGTGAPGVPTGIMMKCWDNPDKNVWSDPEDPNMFGNFHPGASNCIRSKAKGSGEQCCYDSDGNLITGGRGAGSADKSSPSNGICNNFFQESGHQNQDVKPFDWAQILDCGKFGENTKKYYEVRPANNKNNCPENKKPQDDC